MVDSFQDTKTDRRQRAAQRSVRPYANSLLAQHESGEPITAGQVEVLYRELRAYYRSKRPFRMSIWDAIKSMELRLGDSSAGSILARLLDLEQLTRREACELSCSLMVIVSEDVSSETSLA